MKPPEPVIEARAEPGLGAYAARLPAWCAGRLRKAGSLVGLGPGHAVSLLLCGSRRIHGLNLRWRGKDKPTDVLSFPLQELRAGEEAAFGAVGDIVIALPVVRRAARELGIGFEDHLAHLLVHGLLHLLGYDHLKPADARRMEAEERRLLAALNVKLP